MAPRLKVQVQPLTEQRWARLEASLFERFEREAGRAETPRARRRVPVAWLSFAAALGLLVLVLVRGLLGPGQAAIDGTSRITTGKTGSHVALPGLSLDVQPESVLVVSGEPEQALLLVLDRGGVVCNVAPRSSDAPLIVQAGGVRVRVIGTHFSVNREGEGARVAVEHGVVEVSSAGRSWRVTAGEVWPALAPALGPSVDAPVAHASASASGAVGPQAASSDSTSVRAVSPPEVPAIAKGEAPTAPSAQAQFEQATRLERSEPARASALYAALEGGSDSWAQNALYAHGRLKAAQGDKAEARRLLERYLARYPRGTNAGDARAVLDRLR